MKRRPFTKAEGRLAEPPKVTPKRRPDPKPPRVLEGWKDLEEEAFGKRKKSFKNVKK